MEVKSRNNRNINDYLFRIREQICTVDPINRLVYAIVATQQSQGTYCYNIIKVGYLWNVICVNVTKKAVIAQVGIENCEELQIAVDPTTNTVYSTLFTLNGTNFAFGSIDMKTGAFTQLASLGNEPEFVGLVCHC